MRLPVNVRDLVRAGTQLAEERRKPVRLAVVVEMDAPDAVLGVLEQVLVTCTVRADVAIGVAGENDPGLRSDTDALVAVLGSGGAAVAAAIASAKALSVPAVTLSVEGVSSASPDSIGQPLDDFLSGPDPETLVRHDLAAWLADRISSKRLALAANFCFMRPAVSNAYVKATAWQNALIGGVTIIPGTDMPLMTGNQAKMVLQIAAAYGQRLDTERAKELLAVVGGGFAFRAVARQLLDLVPGFGWALKAGVGYSGTIAMGKAAVAYFEQGADVGRVLRNLEAEAVALRERALERRDGGRKRARGLPRGRDRAPYKVEAADADEAGA